MLFRAEKCIDILKCKAYWLVSSSSLQSHIAYTPNLRKIKQLKQSAGGRGDINAETETRELPA